MIRFITSSGNTTDAVSQSLCQHYSNTPVLRGTKKLPTSGLSLQLGLLDST